MPNRKQPESKIKPSRQGQRINIANIVRQLPFHQQLDASQSLLLKIAPTWHEWCEHQRRAPGLKHFSAASDSTPSSFDNGVLTLACRNSSSASLLKHHQTSLLAALHKAGFEHVRRIHVRMALTPSTSKDSTQTDPALERQAGPRCFTRRSRPAAASIKAVETIQRRTKSTQLASSLKRLSETLKKQ